MWVAVVYLGEHYVTDVRGGAAYATAAILAVRIAAARLRWLDRRASRPLPA